MKRLMFRIIVGSFAAIALLILSVAIHRSSGQEMSKPGSYSKLKLTVSTGKSIYKLLEPIDFHFVFANETDRPISGRTVVSFRCCMRMEVRHKGETRDAGQLSAISNAMLMKPNVIPPGGKLPQQTITLQFRLSEIFPEPGTYEVRFTQFSDSPEEKVTSEFVELKIAHLDPYDAAAVDYLKGKSNRNRGIPIEEQAGWSNEELQDVLEEFLTRYGETSFGDLARYRLAMIYYYTDKLDKAAVLFERLKESKDFKFSLSVDSYLKKIDQKRKRN